MHYPLSNFPAKQAEVLLAAYDLSSQGIAPTVKAVANKLINNTPPKEIQRVKSVIDVLKKKGVWAYNAKGEKLDFPKHIVEYDMPDLDSKPVVADFVNPRKSNIMTFAATIEPTGCDGPEEDEDESEIKSLAYPARRKIKLQLAEQIFAQHVMDGFWECLELESQNRLFPAVASIIAKIVEPHNQY